MRKISYSTPIFHQNWAKCIVSTPFLTLVAFRVDGQWWASLSKTWPSTHPRGVKVKKAKIKLWFSYKYSSYWWDIKRNEMIRHLNIINSGTAGVFFCDNGNFCFIARACRHTGERWLQCQRPPPDMMKTSSFPVHLCLTRGAITPLIDIYIYICRFLLTQKGVAVDSWVIHNTWMVIGHINITQSDNTNGILLDSNMATVGYLRWNRTKTVSCEAGSFTARKILVKL